MTSKRVRVGDLAVARSGDKGSHANIGVVALSDSTYELLRRLLTSDCVSEYFRETGVTRVDRFELPNIRGLNFVLHNALGGGASTSLRLDTQGKLLGTALEELELLLE